MEKVVIVKIQERFMERITSQFGSYLKIWGVLVASGVPSLKAHEHALSGALLVEGFSEGDTQIPPRVGVVEEEGVVVYYSQSGKEYRFVPPTVRTGRWYGWGRPDFWTVIIPEDSSILPAVREMEAEDNGVGENAIVTI